MSSKTDKPTPNSIMIERNSMVLSKWANLFMGICGIVAAWLSNSEAILLDGLFSGIGFASAVFAVRIGKKITLPPDRLRPFGYDADEALYTMFRSLSIIGLIIFAVFSASMRIFHYAISGEAPELVFGPIIVYFIVICLTCAALAIMHRINWRRAGQQSDMLKLESNAAIVDGTITAAAGIGLLTIPLLAGTALSWMVPISDSVVLLILCAMIIIHPVFSFRRGLAELAGVTAEPSTLKTMRRIAREEIADNSMRIIDLSVVKIGRNFTVALYVDPTVAVSSEDVDRLAKALERRGGETIGNTRAYVLVSKHGRSWGIEETDINPDPLHAPDKA